MALVVVAALLGALAWWYLRRDDAGTKNPTLTMTRGVVTHSAVTVHWTLETDGAQFQSYEMAYKTATATSWTTSTRTASEPQTHTFGSLNADMRYLFRVTARFEADDAVDHQLTITTAPDTNVAQPLAGGTAAPGTDVGQPLVGADETAATPTLDALTLVATDPVTLQWTLHDVDDTVAGYWVGVRDEERLLDGSGSVMQQSYVFSELSLEPNTAYTFTVTALSTADASLGSAELGIRTAQNPSITIANDNLVGDTDVTVVVGHGGDGDETVTGFRIEYCPPNVFEWDTCGSIVDVSINGETKVSGLVSNTKYRFRVVKEVKDRDVPSAALEVTTRMSAPTYEEHTATVDTVRLFWDGPGDGGGAKTLKEVVLWEEQAQSFSWNSDTGVVSSLVPNTQYTFRLGSKVSDDSVTWSDQFQVTTLMSPPTITGHIPTVDKVQLFWDGPGDHGSALPVSGPLLERQMAGLFRWDADSGVVSALESNTDYVFRLGWGHGNDVVTWSEWLEVTTRMSAPTYEGHTATPNTVRVHWTLPEDEDRAESLRSVELHRWDKLANDWVLQRSTARPDPLEFRDRRTIFTFVAGDLETNTAYTFRLGSVVEIDQYDDDPDTTYTWSEDFEANTRVSAPTFNDDYTATSTTVTLQWTLPEVGGEVATVNHIFVDKKAVLDNSLIVWVRQLALSASSDSGTVEGLAPMSEYTFRVGSVVVDDPSDPDYVTWSEDFTATTQDAMIPAVAQTGQCEYSGESSQSFGTTVLSITRGNATVDDCKRNCDADSRCLGFDRFRNPDDGEYWCHMKGGQLEWASATDVDGYQKTSCDSTSSEACYEERQGQEFARYHNLAYSPSAGSVDECKQTCNQDDQCLGFAYETGRCWFKPRGYGYDWEPTVQGVVGYRKQTCPPELSVALPSINNLRLESTVDALIWTLKWDLDEDGARLQGYGVTGTEEEGKVRLESYFPSSSEQSITFPEGGVYVITVTAWFDDGVVAVEQTGTFAVPADDGTTDADAGSVDCWEVKVDKEFSRGDDLDTVHNATVEQCKSSCMTRQCLGFSFRPGVGQTGTCWLKAFNANDAWVESVGIHGYKKTCE